jgi:hypothetical protein
MTPTKEALDAELEAVITRFVTARLEIRAITDPPQDPVRPSTLVTLGCYTPKSFAGLYVPVSSVGGYGLESLNAFMGAASPTAAAATISTMGANAQADEPPDDLVRFTQLWVSMKID